MSDFIVFKTLVLSLAHLGQINISLINLLYYVDNLALKEIILLFKPQFEVGKNIINKGKIINIKTKSIFSRFKKFKNKETSPKIAKKKLKI